MENFEQEYTYFVDQTTMMNIFARVDKEAYACYRDFVLKALTLLHSELEEPFSQWRNTACVAARREATAEKLAVARKAVEEFRRQQLGIDNFVAPRTSKNDALTVLFMFALEDWPSDPDTQARTSIVQTIDEFSSLYIEFFGRGRELIQVLKDCFAVP